MKRQRLERRKLPNGSQGVAGEKVVNMNDLYSKCRFPVSSKASWLAMNYGVLLPTVTPSLLKYSSLAPTYRRVDVGLEDLRLVQLLVPMRCYPDLAQGAFLGQDNLGIEHDVVGSLPNTPKLQNNQTEPWLSRSTPTDTASSVTILGSCVVSTRGSLLSTRKNLQDPCCVEVEVFENTTGKLESARKLKANSLSVLSSNFVFQLETRQGPVLCSARLQQ